MSPCRAEARAEDARSALTRGPSRSYPWWSPSIRPQPTHTCFRRANYSTSGVETTCRLGRNGLIGRPRSRPRTGGCARLRSLPHGDPADRRPQDRLGALLPRPTSPWADALYDEYLADHAIALVVNQPIRDYRHGVGVARYLLPINIDPGAFASDPQQTLAVAVDLIDQRRFDELPAPNNAQCTNASPKTSASTNAGGTSSLTSELSHGRVRRRPPLTAFAMAGANHRSIKRSRRPSARIPPGLGSQSVLRPWSIRS